MPNLHLRLAASVVVMISSACSSTSSPPTAGASETLPAGEDASTVSSSSGNDGGSCYIVASDYDQSCTQDSDCVLVRPGGDICDPCGGSNTACLACTLTAMNKDASVAYNARLLAALAPLEANSDTATCVSGSCGPGPDSPSYLDGGGPACISGRCTTGFDLSNPGYCAVADAGAR